MNTKIRFLSMTMMLALIVTIISPWTQMTVRAAEETFTFENADDYDALKGALSSSSNDGAVWFDNDAKTIRVDYDKVQVFNKDFSGSPNVLSTDVKNFISSLFLHSTDLQTVELRNVDMSNIDLSQLDGKTSLTSLTVVRCGLQSIPSINLPSLTMLNMSGNDFSASDACAGLTSTNFPKLERLNLYHSGLTDIPAAALSNLKELVLSENDFSSDNACDSLTSTNFPTLEKLYLDRCGISNIEFISNMNSTLEILSLGRNQLTDESLDKLIEMQDKLSNLGELYIGGRIYTAGSAYGDSSVDSSNKITDTGKMMSLLTAFPKLEKLGLSSLGITSLEDFKDISEDIYIDFANNRINDFAGLENHQMLYLARQKITLTDRFNPGGVHELPELLRRILDPSDVLKGTLEYQNCSLSEDGTKIEIKSGAKVNVIGGKLNGSTIELPLKSIPTYTIPKNLTATVGDTLADVTLPEGFTWEDATLDVGAAGTKTFKAVYTPQDTDNYVVVDDIDVSVTVTERDKLLPTYTIPQDLTAHVGDTLADVTLPEGFTWKDATLDVGAAGINTFKAVYTPQDTDTYAVVDNIDVPVTVTERDKLLPTYTIPQDLTANVGDTLADVALPAGFTWKDATLDVGAAGTNTFKAVYTPQDTDTYAVVDNIDVPVTVKAPAVDVDNEEDDDDDTEEAAEVTAVISAKTSDASLILPIAVLLLVSGVAVCIVVSYILVYKKKKTM